MLDVVHLVNCRNAVLSIQSIRQHRGLPPQRDYAQTLAALDAALDAALGGTASGTEPVDVTDDWRTTAQVAAERGCSPRYVRRIAAQLGAVRTGRDWRYPPA